MGKKRAKALNMSEAEVVERAKSMANEWMWAVELQYDRITKPRFHDRSFSPFDIRLFNEVDVHFFVISLRRLRSVASILEHVPQQSNAIHKATQKFDTRLPWLKRLRDVFEHLEDYAVDSNLRQSETCRQELQVWSASEDGMEWLGYDVNWKEGLLAAKDLYDSVKSIFESVALS